MCLYKNIFLKLGPVEFIHPAHCHFSLFFGHHEGPYNKRWEFLNPCIFASDRPLPVCVWANKSVLGPLDRFFFLTVFDLSRPFFGRQKRRCWPNWFLFVRKFWESSSTMGLFLILSTWWTYSQPIWLTKVRTHSKILSFWGALYRALALKLYGPSTGDVELRG